MTTSPSGRYVLPDGELLDVGTTVQALEPTGFEARHVENLREHDASEMPPRPTWDREDLAEALVAH